MSSTENATPAGAAAQDDVPPPLSNSPSRPAPDAPVNEPSVLPARAVDWVVDSALVLGLFAALSFWLNIRYPLASTLEGHLVVALEVPVAFIVLWLCERSGVKLRWWAFALFALVALLARLFITADNIAQRFLYRDFRIPLDLRLVPEFFRLLYDTSPAPRLVGYLAGLGAFLGLSYALVFGGLWGAFRRMHRATFRGATLSAVALSLVPVAVNKLGGPRYFSGEVSSRIRREAVAFTKLPAERRGLKDTIAGISKRIGEGKRLDKLGGANVYFIFVESYGRTSFEKPAHRELLLPRYREMEANLAKDGFNVVSNFVTSPTFGGYSWFAHSTINTGFKVVSHLHFQLLEEEDPKALADYFREAGYRSIHVAPGTTRPWPGMEDHFGFNEHVFAWEFGYQGPRYAWATMADQFVLDRVHRTVVSGAKEPLFLEFALVNSHAPFSDIPNYIEDWSTLGTGAILNQAGRQTFKVTWAQADDIAAAYAASIDYEMRVMEGYLREFIKDDTLVIFVGDHQPNQGVTGQDGINWSVPMHVVSRNPALVAPFAKRGFSPGMVPEQPMPHVGMERFLEEFLSDFSTEPLAVDPGVWGKQP